MADDITKQIIQIRASQSKDNSLDESMHDSIEKHATQLRDAFSNSVLGIGNADHLAQFNDYTFENNTLNWFLWLALYNESWIFRRVIDKPATDMVRPGISLFGTQDYTKVYKELDFLKPDLIDALKWSRLFGGSVMVLLFKGVSFEDMAKPIDYTKIKNCRYIKAYSTDRWFGCEPSYDDIVSNLANDDFGKPKYYTIQFADGSMYKIHHSWVLRFENRTAPNLIKTGQLQGWGYAEGSHLLHELSRDEKLKTSIQSLVDKSLIEVIKMSGMRGLFMGTDKANEEQLKKRLEMVNWGRNFNSLTFLDKDDDYSRQGFNGINGLSDLLQQNMWQIASACEMQGVLFGDLSNGFSHDNDALERYDEKILNDCESFLRKPMTKLLKILYRVYGLDTDNLGFSFNSIIADKKNQQKISDISNLINLCKTMVSENIMTTEQEAKTIQEFINTGSVNFQFTEQNKDEMLANAEATNSNNDMSRGGDLNNDFNDLDTGDMSFNNETLSSTPRTSRTPLNREPENNELEPVSEPENNNNNEME